MQFQSAEKRMQTVLVANCCRQTVPHNCPGHRESSCCQWRTYAVSSSTPLFGRQNSHPACVNFCFKTPWDGSYCKWPEVRFSAWMKLMMSCVFVCHGFATLQLTKLVVLLVPYACTVICRHAVVIHILSIPRGPTKTLNIITLNNKTLFGLLL